LGLLAHAVQDSSMHDSSLWGARYLIDFGRELQGGLRFHTEAGVAGTRVAITAGESRAFTNPKNKTDKGPVRMTHPCITRPSGAPYGTGHLALEPPTLFHLINSLAVFHWLGNPTLFHLIWLAALQCFAALAGADTDKDGNNDL